MKHRDDLIWSYISKDIKREDLAHHEFTGAINHEWRFGLARSLYPEYRVRTAFDRRTRRDTRPVNDRLKRSWICTAPGMVGVQFYVEGVK